ncbi:MAG: phosphoheptose isomerase [Candidatus Cloacimonetes bacterium HGW-Cloacimonetes-1]|jgi:D-sedoheptulose 7-phosphate isomerase|nr:MAG: phosphoheptose isomerase [Candidatus Cloacimonetes bacterium HGW-Cloacimonetes-1]
MTDNIRSAFTKASDALTRFTDDPDNIARVAAVSELIANTFRNKGKVIIFGNGGSMCDAMHFAEEFTGRFRKDRPALPAIAISDPSHLTCVGNDYGFDAVFSRGVEAFALPNDVVIGISTSGNSPNVIRALETAQDRKCFTVALLGKDGGKLRDNCDYDFIIEAVTTDRIQEIHMMILHIIIENVERLLFPELY